jgi:hypothetical protein
MGILYGTTGLGSAGRSAQSRTRAVAHGLDHIVSFWNGGASSNFLGPHLAARGQFFESQDDEGSWIRLSRTRESRPREAVHKPGPNLAPQVSRTPFAYRNTEKKDLLGSFGKSPSFRIAGQGFQLPQCCRNRVHYPGVGVNAHIHGWQAPALSRPAAFVAIDAKRNVTSFDNK